MTLVYPIKLVIVTQYKRVNPRVHIIQVYLSLRVQNIEFRKYPEAWNIRVFSQFKGVLKFKGVVMKQKKWLKCTGTYLIVPINFIILIPI